MKMLLAGMMVLGLLALPALALDAPQNLTVNVVGDDLVLDWDDVAGADKYSVDLELTVIVNGVTDPLEVELSYGTSDRVDGGEAGDSDLTLAIADIIEDIASALGVEAADITSVTGTAKVKALNPGRGRGRQNHPFSDPAVVPELIS